MFMILEMKLTVSTQILFQILQKENPAICNLSRNNWFVHALFHHIFNINIEVK